MSLLLHDHWMRRAAVLAIVAGFVTGAALRFVR
jgi:hypothetical protein